MKGPVRLVHQEGGLLHSGGLAREVLEQKRLFEAPNGAEDKVRKGLAAKLPTAFASTAAADATSDPIASAAKGASGGAAVSLKVVSLSIAAIAFASAAVGVASSHSRQHAELALPRSLSMLLEARAVMPLREQPRDAALQGEGPHELDPLAPQRSKEASSARPKMHALRSHGPSDDTIKSPTSPEAPSVAHEKDSAVQSMQRETSWLSKVRKYIRSGAPTLALAELDSLDQELPLPLLGQERETLRIEAFHQLGAHEEVEHRVRRFLARYPNSPHSEKLRSYLTE